MGTQSYDGCKWSGFPQNNQLLGRGRRGFRGCRRRGLLHRLELGPELRERLVRLGVTLEEIALGGRELHGERLESRVLEQNLVARELEQLPVGRRVVDGREVRVVEDEPILDPRRSPRGVGRGGRSVGERGGRSVRELGLLGAEAAPVGVRPPEGVGAAEGHDLLVAEAHAVEDLAQVPLDGRVLRRRRAPRPAEPAPRARLGVGEVALGGALPGARRVDAAVPHVDDRPAREGDRAGARHLEYVRVRHAGVRFLHRLEEAHGAGESRVRAVVDLGGEADGADGAAGRGEGSDVHVVRAGIVPRETDEHRTAVLLPEDGVDHRLGTGQFGLRHGEGGGGGR